MIPTGTALATVNVNYAYAGEAIAYTNAECGERTVQLQCIRQHQISQRQQA